MVHGDANGLRLPPRVAPIQAVIIPIWRKEAEREQVEQYVTQIQGALGGDVRLHVDRRDDKTPGWKFSEWELKGVPLRIEAGPRDVQNGQVVLVRRDTREKRPVALGQLNEAVKQLLAEIQHDMLESARQRMELYTAEVGTLDELYQRVRENAGFSTAGWCGSEECENAVKKQSSATIRCIPLDQPEDPGTCIVCGKRASSQVVFARAY